MKLDHRFDLTVGPDEAFRVLTDVERIAPCMPGAQLQEIEGDEFRGLVKVKVGPIATSYKGAARFVDRDDAARRAVISASGRDTRGQGTAKATIALTVTEHAVGSSVEVSTELAITGRVAQLGRGAIGEVSAKLLDQFVDSLQVVLGADEDPTGAETSSSPPDVPGALRRVQQPEAEPVELVAAAGPAIAKRVLPIVMGVVLVVFILRRRRHGRRRRAARG